MSATNTDWTALRQAEDMASRKADLCPRSPESYSLEEKEEICNGMASTSKAVPDAMHPKGTLSGLRPSGARRLRAAVRRRPEQAPRHALPVGRHEPRVVVGRFERQTNVPLRHVRSEKARAFWRALVLAKPPFVGEGDPLYGVLEAI